MARINAGKYRHIVTFQRLVETQNSYGETSQNETNNWTDAFTARVGIFPIAGREVLISEAVMKGEITHRIQLRYRDGIDNRMRIKYGERFFDIISAPVNSYEQNHEILLMCKERNVKPTGV